ncbi:MAG: PQQ-dependent sugar dehydrogenase [Lentisphaerales bacterium]|nr:PQQ-dependent sugar dehydrogenase [Lentisphaerales bacterium]
MKYIFVLWVLVFSLPAQDGDPNLEVNILAENIFSGMEISITNDGRVFIAEREGKVKLYDPKTGETKVVLELPTHLPKESGFIGLAIDPNFDKNQWVYLYHTVEIPGDDTWHEHHLGRFDFKDGALLPESEKVLLKVKAAYKPTRIHEGGSIAFDSNGLLYLSTGDNQIRSEYLFSLKTSANTNDLRGKILRIKPEADGTYSIPEGNLFFPGTPKTRPEIYIMGLRNPFRISVDQQTGWLMWGENGPPNNWVPGTTIDKKITPLGYDEFNIAKKAGFHGYPMIIANQQAYYNYDFKAKKQKVKFDINVPINDHAENTGLQNLPPAQPPLIWYEGLQEEFPELGKGGESAISGHVVRNLAQYPEKTRLSDAYEGSWLIGEYARGWVKAVKLDEQGKIKKIMPVLPRLNLGSPTNIKVGPDGRIDVLYFVRGKKLMGDAGYLIRLENKDSSTSKAQDQSAFLSIDKKPRIISINDKGFKFMSGSDCMTCHQWTGKRIGPSVTEIAKKYKGQENTISSTLVEKILKGGGGVWGDIPMMPHPQHTEKQASEMVKTILKLNQIKEH